MAYFSKEFTENIKNAIQRLYDRDKRLKLLPEDFWIIDKDLSRRLEDV